MISTPSTPSGPTDPGVGLSAGTRTLLALAAGAVVLAAVHAAAGVLAPLFLAVVIIIICHPVRFPLEARGWPTWAATTVVVTVAYLILAAMLAMLVWAGFRFASLVQSYIPQLADSVAEIEAQLSAAGIDTQFTETVTSWLQPSNVLAVAGSVSGTVVTVGTAFFFVLAYAVFMAADAARYSTASRIFGATRGDAIARTTRFSTGVRRYYVVNATFGAVVAAIDGVALWLLNVPGAAIWAILAFVTNFVPNIGFVLGLVPPTVMGFVVGGWQLALAVVAVYCVVNVVLQVFVQPKFVSDAVSLSLTLSFVSVVFWTFVIGPLGAILAIPLTLLVRALVLEGDPANSWLRWLSGDDVTDDPPGPDTSAERPAGSGGSAAIRAADGIDGGVEDAGDAQPHAASPGAGTDTEQDPGSSR